MDRDVNSVECGVEAECVGHLYRRGAFQQVWAQLVHHYQVTAIVPPMALCVELSWPS